METVHDRLADAGAGGWEGFTAIFTPPLPFEVPGQIVNPHRFTAKLSYQGKSFSSVRSKSPRLRLETLTLRQDFFGRARPVA